MRDELTIYHGIAGGIMVLIAGLYSDLNIGN
ncbi:hypothetical protein EV200_1086 [Pedobacter psychrotolerans]|uniref:Uncharacterized protein n=1 Tax=Pedobacter psychrotolerans TaxID=1843235 RepID=A0A4R2H568_9SPHI|nr:hypothetical protein EV200_1086 [Pedobacter psychrotolerans]